ncbi:MAG: copper-binding protein [Candidatus Rokubacteria bacterium]|nr:copper-binding protein [Candidatus Rokubacteria bacterium]
MRALKAVVLINLALALGLGAGWIVWGRQVERLRSELALARARPGAEREWRVTGVIRAVLPDIDVVVITHDEIAGFMPPMTMGFRTATPRIHQGVAIGDAVRFTLRGVPPIVTITAIEKL